MGFGRRVYGGLGVWCIEEREREVAEWPRGEREEGRKDEKDEERYSLNYICDNNLNT